MVPGPPSPLGPTGVLLSSEVGWDTLVRGLGDRRTADTRRWMAEKDNSRENSVFRSEAAFHQPESKSGIFVTFSFMGRKRRILVLHYLSGILSPFAA